MDASGASSAIGFHERIIRAGGSLLFALHHAIASRFPKRSPVVPARVSYSHSPSVGNRYRFPPGRPLSFPMNSCASFQETVSTVGAVYDCTFLIRAVIDRPYTFRTQTGSTPLPTVGAVYDCTNQVCTVVDRTDRHYSSGLQAPQ